jgi:hypothetical protein
MSRRLLLGTGVLLGCLLCGCSTPVTTAPTRPYTGQLELPRESRGQDAAAQPRENEPAPPRRAEKVEEEDTNPVPTRPAPKVEESDSGPRPGKRSGKVEEEDSAPRPVQAVPTTTTPGPVPAKRPPKIEEEDTRPTPKPPGEKKD